MAVPAPLVAVLFVKSGASPAVPPVMRCYHTTHASRAIRVYQAAHRFATDAVDAGDSAAIDRNIGYLLDALSGRVFPAEARAVARALRGLGPLPAGEYEDATDWTEQLVQANVPIIRVMAYAASSQ